eukprot:jgi/Botrbrau1/1319/Bobra.0063s0034.1
MRARSRGQGKMRRWQDHTWSLHICKVGAAVPLHRDLSFPFKIHPCKNNP